MMLALFIGTFVVVLGSVGFAGYWFLLRETSASAIDAEPSALADDRPTDGPAWLGAVAGLGEFVALDKDASAERKVLAAAGYRAAWAEKVLFGLKCLGAVLGLTGTFLLFTIYARDLGSALSVGMLGAYIGFTWPERSLRRRIRARRTKISQGLPDFLDLLVIGVESGLSLDHAISDTARDLKRTHPVISDELGVLELEQQAGASRAEALKNLGVRTGEPELKKLASLLIQADRFGSSVARVLRTQARYMRIRRRQLAEEKAHKVGVKMIFPIFLLIMPSVFLVTAGPAVILLLTNLSKMVNGG